jgi:hypothetical protein
LQIPETTTVNVTAGTASSNGNADLTLSASYGGSVLATQNFSVTTGACTASNSGHGGDGPQNCPAQVSLYDIYNVSQYCPTCSFTCIPINFDSTFTPTAGCHVDTAGQPGSGSISATLTVKGTFTVADCSIHSLNIQTTVTNAQGTTSTRYIGANSVLQCNKKSNGSPCP